MLSLFPLDVLDEIWDLVGSVSEGFFYLLLNIRARCGIKLPLVFLDLNLLNKCEFLTRFSNEKLWLLNDAHWRAGGWTGVRQQSVFGA